MSYIATELNYFSFLNKRLNSEEILIIIIFPLMHQTSKYSFIYLLYSIWAEGLEKNELILPGFHSLIE
jgi:hypothetical protein